MEDEKKSLLEIPRDCLRIIYKHASFDLQSVCLLSKTCKHFNTYFTDLIMEKGTASVQDLLWMKSLIERNSTQRTKMLISYSRCHKNVKELLKNEEKLIRNYFYETWPEENRKKLFFLAQQKNSYRDTFKQLYKYSEHQRDSLLLAITGATSITSSVRMKTYRGQWITSDYTKKAFFEFLKQKEFDLMLETVRNNIEFFKDYYDGDHTMDHVYQAGGFELLKKVVVLGVSLEKTHRLMCTASKNGDVELVELLLHSGLKCRGEFDALNILNQDANPNIKQINELLIAHYYTQDDKNKLLQDALYGDSTQLYRAIYLQEHGADITSVPLELLCKSDRYIDEIKSRFIANPELVSRLDDTAQSEILLNTLDSDNLELLEFICQQGFDLNILLGCDWRDQTILRYVITNHKWDAAKILMKHGADINHDDILNGFYHWCYFDKRGEKGPAEQFVLDNGFDVDGTIQKLTGTDRYPGLVRHLIAYKAEKGKTEAVKQEGLGDGNFDHADQKSPPYCSFFKSFYLSYPVFTRSALITIAMTQLLGLCIAINYAYSQLK